MPRTEQPKHPETNTGAQPTQRGPKPVFRFSLSSFLGALVLNLLISPFVDQLRGGTLIETMLMTLVLLCAVLSIAGGRGALVGVVLVARMLAMVEAMFGMIYMTLLIARLVSLYSSKTPPGAPTETKS
jgi:predicted lipid-binding transport protein (Tim44 family)